MRFLWFVMFTVDGLFSAAFPLKHLQLGPSIISVPCVELRAPTQSPTPFVARSRDVTGVAPRLRDLRDMSPRPVSPQVLRLEMLTRSHTDWTRGPRT